MTEGPLTYERAGVSLEAAAAVVDAIAGHVGRATRPEVLGGIGGFGGLFALDTARWREPVLVAATDGVGTKLELARQTGLLDGVGADLVAMVVDDLVVPGAEALFFLDYVAVERLDPAVVARVVASVADACASAGCALLGGETAEHPGAMPAGAFDLAGFGVGVVERDAVLGPQRVRAGDALVALASSGLHSNGFSLVRAILVRVGADLEADALGSGRSLAQDLLEPTRIHAPDCLALLDAVEVHALCHVTGGGLPGNLPRVMPADLEARVDRTTWTVPPVFRLLQGWGSVPEDDLWRTFNCGVGMVAVVPDGDAAVGALCARGVDAWVCGEVVARQA